MFGILILDREPYLFTHLPGLLQAWLQDAGGFVFAGLIIYVLAAVLSPTDQSESNRERLNVPLPMLLSAVIAMLCYSGYIAMIMNNNYGADTAAEELKAKLAADPNAHVKVEPPKVTKNLQAVVLTLAGFFSFLGALYPILQGLGQLSGRRIFALAKLAFLEAVRNRVIWLFLIILLPILFPMAWFLPSKAEDELRLRITWMNVPIQVVLFLTSALLAAFAIPNDIKNQNIFTIVTKPVHRFEIILGRFLGYSALISLALLAIGLVSLIFITTANINDKAREETYTARVPVRGRLKFESRVGRSDFVGTDVGREFSYRKYIAGDPDSPQRAVWSFAEIPSGLLKMENDAVPCEFTFDIFRLTKGEENRGVDVNIRVVTWKCGQSPPLRVEGKWPWTDPEQEQRYFDEARELLRKLPKYANSSNIDVVSALATPRESPDWEEVWKIANTLAERYGFYEIPTKEVYDYHPERVIIPAGLFRNAREGTAPKDKQSELVKVYVKCTSRSQMLGMAEPDLYIMEREQAFWQNYLKSILGIWYRIILIIALAVCLSAYLDGIVSFLVMAFLFISGYFTAYLAEMASGRSFTGGPFKSLNQLLQAKQSTAMDEETAALKAALFGDKFFSWAVRRFINLVPDVETFSWTPFVSEGFNISFEHLIMNFLVLIGYSLPWFILGYFVIRLREVANP